ncbi:hypothetical protein Tco_0443574 [Tanacetum coccineum]
MVMVLDIKIDVDLDFIRHWLDAWSETAICHKESKALTDTNAAAQHEDFMDIDEPSDVATHRPPFAPLLSARELDLFSLLEPSHLGITSSGPFVSHGTNSESRHPEKGVSGGNSDVTPSAPSISDLPDDGIEELMIQAATEAAKRKAELGLPDEVVPLESRRIARK